MANIEKLEAVLDYIRTHPEEHDQGTWAAKTDCGTAMCFAGTAVMLAGYEFVWDCGIDGTFSAHLCRVPPGHPDELCRWGQDELAEIPKVAQRELGLTNDQKNWLFFHSDTLDDLEAAVKDITNEQGAA